MILQTFNVFGRVIVDRDQITIQFNAYSLAGKHNPTTITSEEGSPEIPVGVVGEFLFGLDIGEKEHHLFTYEPQTIDDDSISFPNLPIVKKYMEIISDVIRKFEKLTQ